MKICVYTCITGKYDRLNPVVNQTSDIDFICFTDNSQLIFNSGNWDIRNIPSSLRYYSDVRKQRLIKILPHRFLKEYDLSLWIDGNISIIGDMMKFIEQYDEIFLTRKHPTRDCTYQEAEAVLRYRKDTRENVYAQIDSYRKEGFPEHYGLEETNIILRRHNDRKCMILDNMWAVQIIKGSHRDQLSFDYCRWKTHTDIGFLNVGNLNRDSNFRIHNHG